MKANRRQLLMAGAVAAAATVANTELSFAADLYGSGQLGAWTQQGKAISSAATIAYVLENDGVFMFGDSIAVQDGKALGTRLNGRDGSSLAVHNWSGRPTAPAVDALQSWATTYGLPRRILMATGTNDIFNPPAMAAQIDRAMRIVGSSRTVIWVNTQISRTTQSSAVQVADQRNSAWVNSQLSEAQGRYSNLRIVKWAEFLAAKPSRLNTYLRQGVHTTIPQGQDSRNELIVQALTAR
ncbi:hypothetical protein [Kribbella sp. NPDC055071]